MYKKFETSWLKHIDFLLVDVLGLQLGFTIAYLLSFAIFDWDASYFGDLYFQISMMLLVINGCAGFWMKATTTSCGEDISRRAKRT